jgi:gliding motility-associated-like protein
LNFFFRTLPILFFLFLCESGYGQITSCNFSLSQTSGCAPFTILATPHEVTSSTIISRIWTLTTCTGSAVYATGPGTNSTFSFIATNPDCYCLSLESTDQNGNTCTSKQCNITAAVKPNIDFTFTPSLLEGCQPFTIQSLCNSTPGSGTIDSITIDWGCSGISNYASCAQASTTHTYSSCPLGCVSPTVIIKNSFGCYADTVYRCLVNIIPDPVASFTADTTLAYCTTTPLKVTFTAAVTDPDLTYVWYINNVEEQTSGSRTFVYSFPVAADCYDVKLAVYHPSGCADSVTRTGYICVQTNPQISFTPSAIQKLCANQDLVLTNTTNGLSQLTWQLSGGSPPQTFTAQTGATATFPLADGGTYTVSATGVFSAGCTQTVSQEIATVSAPPVASISTTDTFSCKVPYTATLSAGACTNCSYYWIIYFFNLTDDTLQVQNLQLTEFASYSARLVVTDRQTGCSDTVTDINLINVDSIKPQIEASQYKGCGPLAVELTNVTNLTDFPEPISSICWSFPGSNIATVCGKDSINETFSVPGCYSVELSMQTASGCKNSLLLTDTLCDAKPPVCEFNVSVPQVCFAECDTVHFTLTCDSFSYAQVNFNEAQNSPFVTMYTPSFTHQFNAPGDYCVTAIAFKDSCSGPGDTMTACLKVLYPVANFNDSSTCAIGDTVIFVNNSKGATSYLWTFCNDSDTSGVTQPEKILPLCSTCNVTLVAYNDTNGCSHKVTQQVLTPCNSASFSPMDTSVCGPLYFNFTNTSVNSQTAKTTWNINCSDPTLWGQQGPTPILRYGFTTPGVYCIGMANISNSGCRDTVYGTFNVCNILPNFGYDTSCFPLPICFHDSSVNYCLPTTWLWNFGDDSTSTAQNPCHTYLTTGIYNVKLTVSNGTCSNSITQQVGTSQFVNINYYADSIICPGSTLCIQDNSSGNGLTYSWIAPGASPSASSAAAPCLLYAQPIDTFIYFTLTSNNQCTYRDTLAIHAHTPVAGGYDTIHHLACPRPPVPIQFINTSKYVDSLQIWTFGDGNGSTDANPAHIYAYPGTYIVRLKVVDRNGCEDSTVIDTITVSGPFGSYTYTPTPGVCACQDSIHYTVKVWNTSSIIMLYSCTSDFTNDSIPSNSTPADTNVFMFSWLYCVDSVCTPNIQVSDSNCEVLLPTVAIYSDTPSVKFTFNSYGVCGSGQICFSDSTHYHLGSGQSFTVGRIWEFGDGGTDTSANPCHYFADTGVYDVKLIIYSNLGCIDSNYVAKVVVPSVPIADYYADDSFVCDHFPICFYDSSQIYRLTNPWYWSWNFGDGTGTDTTYTKNICHTYNTPGYFSVIMCVYDSLGCSDCDTGVMHVIANPVAKITVNTYICDSVPALIEATGGTSYSWTPRADFANPDTSVTNVELSNTTTVDVVVGNSYGCKDTATALVNVAHVIANFIADSTDCQRFKLCVTDASTGSNDILTTWLYYFGDGDSAKTPDACNLYTVPGNYNIKLTVTDNYGCADSIVKAVVILPSPVAQFSLSSDVICSNQQVCITNLSSSVSPITGWYWSYGDGQIFAGSNPPCHMYQAPYIRNYLILLVATAQNGCNDSAELNLALNVIPQAVIKWAVSCEDDSMALESISTPGSAAVAFCQWTFWLGAANPVIDSNFYTYFKFPAGQHDVQLIVRDLNGCLDTTTQQVLTDSLTQLTLTPGDTTICLGTSVNYYLSGIFTNAAWVPDIWVSNPDSSVATIQPLATIQYFVTAANGVCPGVTDSFIANVIQPVPVQIGSTLQEAASGRDLYDLVANIAGVPREVTVDSIIWTPDSTLSCRNCTSTLATPFEKTTYTVEVYYSENGITCSNTAQITVDVNGCGKSYIFVPNTFTPNGDGRNDVLMIRTPAATKIISFRIFDRWGRIVFEISNGIANQPQFGWNGNDMEGKKLNSGVYVYTYEIECFDGNVINGQGNVSLIR